MKLTRISKYGFQVDNKPTWINYDKSFDEKVKFEKDNINSEIDFVTNDKGFVTRIEYVVSPKNTENTTSSLSVKIIACDDLSIWEGEINDFGRKNNVKFTQTMFANGKYVACLFYE